MKPTNMWCYVEALRKCKHFLLTEYTISCNVEELVTLMYSKGHIDYHLNQRIHGTHITWDKLDLLLDSLIEPSRDKDMKAMFDDLVAQLSTDPCLLYIPEKLTVTLEEVRKLTPEKPIEVIQEVKRIHEGIPGMRVTMLEIHQCLGKILTDYDAWYVERSKKQNEGVTHEPSVEDTCCFDEHNTPLMTAAINDDYAQLKELLSQSSTDVNAVNGKGETALSLACRKASAEFVKRLLQTDNIKLNLPDKLGRTAFMHCMVRCDIEVIDVLLQYDILDLDVTDNNGLNYIWYLLPKDILNDMVSTIQVPKNLRELETCLANCMHDTKRKQATINWERKAHVVTFLLSCERINNIDLLTTILLMGTETLVALVLSSHTVEIKEESVKDIILNAITAKNADVIKILCESPKIPFKDINHDSAKTILKHASHHYVSNTKRLMVCVTSGPHISKALKIAMVLNSMDVYTVSVLVDQIDFSITDEDGNDIFMILCEYSNIELLEQLLEYPKINLTTKNHNKKTAYMISFKNQSKDVSNLILKHCLTRMDINGKDLYGTTSLMYASKFGNYDVVKTLLSHPDINTNMRDQWGHSALLHACRSGVSRHEIYCFTDGWPTPYNNRQLTHDVNYARIAQLLLQCKTVDKDVRDDDGNNLSMLASAAGNLEIVATLLDSCATDINATNERGLTACHIACLRGIESIVTKLLETGKVDMNATGKYSMIGCACAGGNEAVVSKSVEMGVDVNSKDDSGRTGLIHACEWGRESVVEVLLMVGNIDVHVKDKYGDSALFYACRNGLHKIVSKLIEHTPDIEVTETDSEGINLFMAACVGGNTLVVKMCLDMGVNVNGTDNVGKTGLIMACARGREAVVDILLGVSGTRVDIKDNNGDTALLHACNMRERTIVSKLMQYTPVTDVNEVHSDGTNVFMAACRGGDVSIVEMCLKMGADVNETDNGGQTGLMWACEWGSEGVVDVLLAVSDIDACIKDNDGCNALFYACRSGELSIVTKLMEHTPITDVNEPTSDGMNLFMAACEGGLVSMGADVNGEDNCGWTGLMWACEWGRDEVGQVVDVLVAVSDIDVNVQNEEGDTALIVSCQRGNERVVEMLLRVTMIDVNVQNNLGETALIVACKTSGFMCNERRVEMLLSASNIDVHVKDKTGQNALAWSCVRGHDRITTMLKDAGVIDESESSALIGGVGDGSESSILNGADAKDE